MAERPVHVQESAARFVIYRDQQIAGAADDITQALAQAKQPGDLLNACAVHDRENQIILIITGWVPIGVPVTVTIPEE